MAYSIDIRGFAEKIAVAAKAAWTPRLEMAKARLEHRILRDTTPFVPYDTGQLNDSAELLPGQEVGASWNTDYSWYVFHMPPDYDFNKTVHPEAGPEWTYRAIDRYRETWVRFFEKVLRGY